MLFNWLLELLSHHVHKERIELNYRIEHALVLDVHIHE
jgi:hypothetical protein